MRAAARDYSRTRRAVLVRDDFTCQYCGRRLPEEALTVDHMVPRARGGSEDIENLVTACRTCNIEKGNQDLSDYLAETIKRRRNYYTFFQDGLAGVEALLTTRHPEEHLQRALFNLLYANVITILETYLSETLIGAVLHDHRYMRRLVEASPDFSSRKMSVADIFSRMDALETEVKDYLLGLVYHNLAKVKELYEHTLGIEFPGKLDAIFKAIQLRHDIVHRAGKAKDGSFVLIQAADIKRLIAEVKRFAEAIEKQLPTFGRPTQGLKRMPAGTA